MKVKVLIALLFLSVANFSIAANYVLTIDNKSYELSLNEEIHVKVAGKYVPVKLKQKDIFLYSTDNFSFEHPKKYSPSKTDLGDGIFQTAMMTPLGSVVLIQEYLSLDPTNIIDFMIKEVTKEELEYGYKIDSRPTSLTLLDGKVLKGKIVTSKYRGSDIKRIFYTYGHRDSGLLIMTQVDHELESDAAKMLDKLIHSLKINMK